MKPKWAERLSKLLDATGWSVAEFTRRVNADKAKPEIGESSIRKYLKGKVLQPRGEILSRLAETLGTTELELRYDLSPDEITRKSRQPLFTASELAELDHANDLRAWEGRFVNVLSNDVGPDWFGVIVPDDACAERIPKGAIVYCDPDAPVGPGDFVIAKVPGHPTVVCRKFREVDPLDHRRFTLVPTNEDYGEFKATPDLPIVVWRIMKVLSDP